MTVWFISFIIFFLNHIVNFNLNLKPPLLMICLLLQALASSIAAKTWLSLNYRLHIYIANLIVYIKTNSSLWMFQKYLLIKSQKIQQIVNNTKEKIIWHYTFKIIFAKTHVFFLCLTVQLHTIEVFIQYGLPNEI